MTTTPDAPDPEQVEAKVREFEALELRDSIAFRECLATNIMEPDPVETLAFRSEQLAFKSLAAARELIENAQAYQKRDRQGSRTKMAREAFIQRVGRERRILQMRVDGIRAEKGLLPNQPNPRRRAETRFWNLAIRGVPVPAELVDGDERKAAELGALMKLLSSRLLEQEVEKDRERKREQKRARKEARKATRP